MKHIILASIIALGANAFAQDEAQPLEQKPAEVTKEVKEKKEVKVKKHHAKKDALAK